MFNALGEVTAAIGISVPTANSTKQRVHEMAQQISWGIMNMNEYRVWECIAA